MTVECEIVRTRLCVVEFGLVLLVLTMGAMLSVRRRVDLGLLAGLMTLTTMIRVLIRWLTARSDSCGRVGLTIVICVVLVLVVFRRLIVLM